MNDALTLDPDENSTQTGMLALQSWCTGVDGPEGQWVRSQFCKFDAGIVATQTALKFVPDTSDILDIETRMHLIEQIESDRRRDHEEVGGEPCDVAVAKQTRDDLEHFRVVLAETSQAISSLQSELRTKAGQLDTSSALDLLRRELIKLAATAVGRHQLHTSLNSKLDRRDLSRIAALIANGELEGINPSVLFPPQ